MAQGSESMVQASGLFQPNVLSNGSGIRHETSVLDRLSGTPA